MDEQHELAGSGFDEQHDDAGFGVDEQHELVGSGLEEQHEPDGLGVDEQHALFASSCDEQHEPDPFFSTFATAAPASSALVIERLIAPGSSTESSMESSADSFETDSVSFSLRWVRSIKMPATRPVKTAMTGRARAKNGPKSPQVSGMDSSPV